MRPPVPGAAIGLATVRFARFFQALDLAERVRQPGFREQVGQVATTVFEDAKHVGGFDAFPGWQWIQLGDDAVLFRDGRIDLETGDFRRLRRPSV